ncbi:MAG: serine/threonine protein kinase [Muribaculaceae bacterium]|nr:serine/threonine protein kinase [Muribaculaceae bacterium]
MNQIDPEEGFVGIAETYSFIDTEMADIENVSISGVNVLARGRRYGRQWLLKGLKGEFQDSTQAVRQLMKEFEIHSRLNHPGIVRAIGFEEFEGLGKCIVEEWIEGKTLTEVLRDGSLSVKSRRRIIHQIVESVAYLHGKGVVHRDLKPSNIMIRSVGTEPVLIDFGMADTGDYVEMKGPAGTDGFISPEQLAEGGAHPSDDVYSLGVIIRDMCPEYETIARKCVGPLKKRPADARALLSLIDRWDRRPMLIGGLLSCVAIIAMLIIAALKITSLNENSREAQSRIVVLTDSLNMVRQELQDVETYNRLHEEVVNEGRRRIDSVLTDYDRTVFNKMTQGNFAEFPPAVIKLQNELRQTAEDYYLSVDSCGLKAPDLEQAKLDLYNYYTVTMTTYHNKWVKKVFPEMNLTQ